MYEWRDLARIVRLFRRFIVDIVRGVVACMAFYGMRDVVSHTLNQSDILSHTLTVQRDDAGGNGTDIPCEDGPGINVRLR